MRKFILILTTALLLSTGAKAQSVNCGFQPFKPMNCIKGQAICSCDFNGNCSWQLTGC